MNYLDPKTYKTIFRIATGIIILDFLLNIIWLPIAVSKSYGFHDASYVFTQTFNETGAPPVWNWMLSFYVTAGILVGFEASGHISEVCCVGTASQMLILTLVLGDAKCDFSRSARNILVSHRVGAYGISYGHSVPFLSSESERTLQLHGAATVRADLRVDVGSGWSHIHEHYLHHWSHLQYDNCWCCRLTADLGCCQRWSAALLQMDISSVSQEGTEERNHCHAWCGSTATLHHLALSSRVHLACKRCSSANYHRLCVNRFWTLLRNATQLQTCSIQPRTLESPTDLDCLRMEPLLGRNTVLASLLPNNGRILQLLLRHFCGDHALWSADIPLHARGQVAACCSAGQGASA